MHKGRSNPGIRRLTQKYRAIFRVPENLNHYSEKDLQIAERKFLKYAMEDGISFIDRRKATSRLYTT